MVDAVTMMRRRLIALTAAYAIALQAVLASFAALAAVGTGLPGLCTSSAPQEQPARHTGHTALCVACPACCGDGRPPGRPSAGIEVQAPTSRGRSRHPRDGRAGGAGKPAKPAALTRAADGLIR